MFTTTRETGGRRRTKVYASNATAKSSKTSLLSVFTVGSAGSGDSNSTITQNSYNRSQHRRRRRTRHHRHRAHESRTEDRNKSVDVFDFLVEKDGSNESLSVMNCSIGGNVNDDSDEDPENEFEDLDEQDECDQCEEIEELDRQSDCGDFKARSEQIESSIAGMDETKQSSVVDPATEGDIDSDDEVLTPDIVIQTEDAEPERFYRSMSDSGISVGGCSMDTSLASLPPRLSIHEDEPLSRPASRSQMGNELAVIDPRWTWSTSPGPFHDGYIPPPAPVPPPIMYEMPPYPPYPPYTPYGTPPPMRDEDIRGPAIRIREPSQQDVKPNCFRSFTKVSTRVALQLQDDIAELEGELSVLDAELDAIEADSGSDDDAPPHPRTAKPILKAREAEIYDELQFKLGQYSSALEYIHRIEDISQPATKSDLTKHHRWLEARISPSFRARHLVGNDLRTFSAVKSQEPAPTPGHDTRFLTYIAMVNTLLPLLTFKLVSNILTRLILLLVIVISGVAVHDRTKAKVRKEDVNCILTCVGISIVAAFLL